MIPRFQILILAFDRVAESNTLLSSIIEHVKIPRENFWITYLSNGSSDNSRIIQWLDLGLIDQLILRKKNTGGSWGMVDLANLCQSKYAFLVQNDQFLINDITDSTIDYFMGLLDSGYQCVDVSGGQCGANTFSDRASFVKIEDYYNWTKNLNNFGPGFEGDGDHNEGEIQKIFRENNFKVAHISPLLFADNGKWSIRQHEDGSVTKWSTDEKRLYLIIPPTKKMKSLKVDDNTWDKILSGKWIDGDIPYNWKKDSFLYWNNN